MKVREAMTGNVCLAAPDRSIREAARMMADQDIGALPVGENDRLIGMVTDRDIAVRAVAQGRGPDTPVRDAMSEQVLCCYEDEEIEEVAMKMSDAQVRRFPVLSRDGDRLVGIVSLGDLSRSEEGEAAAVALGGITDPGGAHDQSNETQ